jgi:hypothetical protein
VRRGILGAAVVLACAAFAATAASAGTDEALALKARVLRAGDLVDFTPSKRPSLTTSPDVWASNYLSTISLRKNGFVSAVRQELASKRLKSTAVSTAVLFRTPLGARRELASELAQARRKGSNYAKFRVRGIPHAYGYRLASPGSKGYNVMFRDGPFVYLVGAGYHPAAKQHLARADVIRAAKRLYARVQGRPAA